MVNFSIVIEKIMGITGLSNDKDIAKALDISPQDFSNRKKRGTLLPVIVEWALREKVSIDWLLTGEERIEKGGVVQTEVDPVTAETNAVMAELSEKDRKGVLLTAKEKKYAAMAKEMIKLKNLQTTGIITLNLCNILALPGMICLALVGFGYVTGPQARIFLASWLESILPTALCILDRWDVFGQLLRNRFVTFVILDEQKE
jgi:Bacteriophage CI repressor helix-turn-helix domain